MLIQLDHIDSTNSYLKKYMKSHVIEDGTIVSASYQTAGRGYHSNKWLSEPNQNILFSLYKTFISLSAENQFLISACVSLEIVDSLAQFGVDAQIKWPNDIYVEDKKIAGILIENQISGNRLASTLIGVGLNVNQTHFRQELPNPTSMRKETDKEFDLLVVLKMLETKLIAGLTSTSDNKSDILFKAYLDKLYRYEEWHKYKMNDQVIEGMITGVDQFGRLILSTKGNETLVFGFKEIEYLI